MSGDKKTTRIAGLILAQIHLPGQMWFMPN